MFLAARVVFSTLHPRPPTLFALFTWRHRRHRRQQLHLHTVVAEAQGAQHRVACRALGRRRRAQRGAQQRLHHGQGAPHHRDVGARQRGLGGGVAVHQLGKRVHGLGDVVEGR